MNTRKHGGADGQSYIFKTATVIILVFIVGALFLIQKEMRKAGGTAQTYVQPVEKNTFKAAKEPMRTRVPASAAPSMTPGAQPEIAVPSPKAANPPALPTFTQAPAQSAAPPPPRTYQSGVQRLPTPVTQVHPLSDAEEVMGVPSSMLGAAPPQPLTSQPGVQKLPVPDTEVHPLSDAEEVMGAPSSELGEVGVTRTYKLPEQKEQNETLPPPNE
jgi:hypothetical protein